jgi:hypothetical protein
MRRWPFAAQVGNKRTFHHAYMMMDMDVLTRPEVNGVVASAKELPEILETIQRFSGVEVKSSSLPVYVRTRRPRPKPSAGALSTVGVHRMLHRGDCTGQSCSN